ncbi:MAG: peptide deformylase [Pirellulaceae bacterium]|nr:peptide deformylase [Pirellulaceae bacterium]
MRIVHYPHPTLRHVSKPIKRVDAELRRIVRQMFDLMYEARGIGLAANQVDLPLRLFVINLAAEPTEGDEMVFINPVLNLPKGSDDAEEGCLSIPGIYGHVVRPARVKVSAYSLTGQEIQADLDGLLARAVQHELDHLDGVLFPDRMSMTSRADLQPALDEFESEFRFRRETGDIPSDDLIRQRLAEWETRYCV